MVSTCCASLRGPATPRACVPMLCSAKGRVSIQGKKTGSRGRGPRPLLREFLKPWLTAAVLGCGLFLSVAAAKPQHAAPAPETGPPLSAIERWNNMTPAERERELAKLPPARAAWIREHIRQFNSLPPATRQALIERGRRLEQLPPPQQALVRQRLTELRQLPPERAALVRVAIRRFSALPAAQRQARFASPAFQSRFSPQEQQIIRDITGNFPDF
jgi:hypothetical protein